MRLRQRRQLLALSRHQRGLNVSDGLVWMPTQTAVLGSDHHYPEEAPARDVTVDGFAMMTHQVTNAQFAEFVTASDDMILEGTAGADDLAGDTGNDLISGFGGDDKLTGNAGADTLEGGGGADELSGGDGDDLLYGAADGSSSGDKADVIDGG